MQAAKKAVGPARELRVEMNSKNGDIKAFAKLIVADKVISQHDQISMFDARRIKADAKVAMKLKRKSRRRVSAASRRNTPSRR